MRFTLGVLCVLCCFSTYSVSESRHSSEVSVDDRQAQLRMDGAKWFPVDAIDMCGNAKKSSTEFSEPKSKYQQIVAAYEGNSFTQKMAQANPEICQVKTLSGDQEA
ncbi:hypothetical protein TDB9533_04151 [Thalassocella blandensis]|nr:hypothetical protein TDB9533_04151 [Thalassocella blandensis]